MIKHTSLVKISVNMLMVEPFVVSNIVQCLWLWFGHYGSH